MRLLFFTYRYMLFPLAYGLLHGAQFFSPKLRAGVQLRKGKPWLRGEKHRRPFWVHCASGEFEYAKPILRQLKQQFPEIPILVTYFSPSVLPSLAKDPNVDIITPLPWDTPSPIREFLQFHHPRCLAIARTDLWPELLEQTAKAKIPTLLFSKTMNSEKSRWARKWEHALLEKLDSVFLVSETDRSLLNAYPPAGPTLRVTGDTRYDQCLFRLAHPAVDLVQREPTSQDLPTVLFASTWAADEKHILPVIERLSRSFSFIIVPHEPSPYHVKTLRTALLSKGLDVRLFSEMPRPPVSGLLIVDTVGALADLYQWCDFAYVGGSFDRGVHSVMEALAQGKPCLVGPKNQNNREVQDFRVLGPTPELHFVEEVAHADDIAFHLANWKDLWDSKCEESLKAQFLKRTGATPTVVQWMAQYSELQ